jgi:hypothetical protein
MGQKYECSYGRFGIRPGLRRLKDPLCGYRGSSGRFYLMSQPSTIRTATTMMIVASNPSPALFFPNLNVIQYNVHFGLCGFA